MKSSPPKCGGSVKKALGGGVRLITCHLGSLTFTEGRKAAAVPANLNNFASKTTQFLDRTPNSGANADFFVYIILQKRGYAVIKYL